MKNLTIDKSERKNYHREMDKCIDIGHVRVYTQSLTKAAKVAGRVRTLGGKGTHTVNGERIKWESLAHARRGKPS